MEHRFTQLQPVMFYLRCFTPMAVWLSEDDVICLFEGWILAFPCLQLKSHPHGPVHLGNK